MEKIHIVHKSNEYIILEKPSGLLMHKGNATPENEATLTDWLLKEFPEIKNIGESHRPGIVHRLDKDVSGLIIIAKTKESYDFFVTGFKEKTIQKTYTALCFGNIKKTEDTIITDIKRSKKDFRKYQTAPGTSAKTKYIVKKYCEDVQLQQDFSLVEISPITGRTHQIRVHLSSISHPIVGDKKYSFKPQRKINPTGRIFLHASKLEFTDLKGKKQIFSSPLPKKLQTYLTRIKCV